MKITFLGNFSVDYGSETYHKKALESLGHTVTAFQETQAGTDLVLDESLKSDLFVWVHTQGWNSPGTVTMREVLATLKQCNVPSVSYHLDLLFGLHRQADLGGNDVFRHIDHFFTVDKQMADWLNSNTKVQGHYLPAAVSHEECVMLDRTKPDYQHDVVFVGSKGYHPEWPYRPQLINWLKENYNHRFAHYGPDGLGVVRGLPLNSLYADSKIAIGDSLCLDFSYQDYWSDRVYETLGRGGFMIHPYIDGMENSFADKKHLVYYKFGNFNRLRELIDYYIDAPEEREEIRRLGHRHVRKNHTYRDRWKHILQTVFHN